MAHPFDLHSHSCYSDGTAAPADIVRCAKETGLELFALTDHDCMDGVPEAVQTGEAIGLPVIPAVELDNEWKHELHIIGLDVDPDNALLKQALELARERRERRNRIILSKLKEAGYDVEPFVKKGGGCVTKLHVAMALIEGGFAHDVRDAFTRYLKAGQVGYYTEPRFTPAQVIELIHAADGLPVLAHPCHIRDNPHGLVRELTGLGLMGIEAYYPSSTPRQTELYVSLGHLYKLLITCGSDYHGDNRPASPLGCAWQDTRDLEQTFETLKRRIES